MKKYISIIIITVAVFASCSEDTLLREPQNFLSPTGFSNEEDIVLALNGTYRRVLDGSLLQIEFTTDYGFMDKSWAGMIDFWDQRQNSTSAMAKAKWSRNYSGILRANTVIANIDRVTVATPELRERYRAEAKFLRALFYTDLMLYYGGVPLRTTPDGLEAQHIARESRADVIDFIYQDLDSAMAHLPLVYDESNRGRATKGAAQTLKAWVALNDYNYETALLMCDSIIASGAYQIFPVYEDLFNSKAEATNKEVIFDMQYIYDSNEFGLSSPWTGYFNAWGSYMVTHNLGSQYYAQNGLSADSTNLIDTINNPGGFDPNDPFANRDPRLGYTLMAPYDYWYISTGNGLPVYYIPYNMKGTNFTSYRVSKYVNFDIESSLRSKSVDPSNIVYFRYADVLMIRAEALCELYGAARETDITNMINQVRQRSDVMMPMVQDAEGTGLSQEQLRDIIRHERVVEFAIEGKRKVDIQRWQIGEEAYSDGWGYNPEFLYYYQASANIIEEMEEDDIIPSNMMRYLKRESSDGGLYNMMKKTEEEYRAVMATIFTPANRFNDNELETYGDLIIKYVGPRYIPYIFRTRTFDATKGYLWPIPFDEMQTNNLITGNNPGYN